jgi:protein involved in polysaccharide export with SLBB domain
MAHWCTIAAGTDWQLLVIFQLPTVLMRNTVPNKRVTMKLCIHALTILMAAVATGCAGPRSDLPQMASAAPGVYLLGAGDEIRINVLGLEAMNATYIVGDTGAISLPMLEPLQVEGKSIRAVEAQIADAILERQLVLAPKVSAQIQVYRPFFILGEVQRPGHYPYIPGMSVITAVSVAGGYTFRADTKKAIITRVARKGEARKETPVMPGDTIEIRESWF